MDILREILVLLVCGIMCVGTTSCKRSRTKMVEGQPKGDGKNVLSREQIIQIANGEAHRQGFDPETLTVFYDEGNSHWRTRAGSARPLTRDDVEAAILDLWPKLKGHDYQAGGNSGDSVLISRGNSGDSVLISREFRGQGIPGTAYLFRFGIEYAVPRFHPSIHTRRNRYGETM